MNPVQETRAREFRNSRPRPTPGTSCYTLRPHICTTCPKSYVKFHHLRRHERVHNTVGYFRCQSCSARFSRRDSLLRHQRSIHVDGITRRNNSSLSQQQTGLQIEKAQPFEVSAQQITVHTVEKKTEVRNDMQVSIVKHEMQPSTTTPSKILGGGNFLQDHPSTAGQLHGGRGAHVSVTNTTSWTGLAAEHLFKAKGTLSRELQFIRILRAGERDSSRRLPVLSKYLAQIRKYIPHCSGDGNAYCALPDVVLSHGRHQGCNCN